MNIFLISLFWAIITFYLFGEVVAVKTISLNRLKFSFLGNFWFCTFMGLSYIYLGIIYGLLLTLIGLGLYKFISLSLINILSIYTGLSVAIFGYFLTKWQINKKEKIQMTSGFLYGLLFALLFKFFLYRIIDIGNIYWLSFVFIPALISSIIIAFLKKEDKKELNGNIAKEKISVDVYKIDKKTIFIGLDCCDPRLLNNFLRKGRNLPNLKRLIDNGVYSNLKTLYPTTSPIIWNSIFTGKTPKEHGILNWYKIKFPFLPEIEKSTPIKYPEDSRANKTIRWLIARGIVKRNLYDATDRKEKAFWNILTDFNKKSINIGWMCSWPAEEINGIQVSCYMYPFEETTQETKRLKSSNLPKRTYPEKLSDELEKFIIRVNDLTKDDLRKVNFTTEEEIDYYLGFEEKLNPWDYAKDKTFLEISRYLVDKNQDFDFFSLFLYGIDTVGHVYWPFFEWARNEERHKEEVLKLCNTEKFKEDSKHFDECLPKYYKFIDKQLGKLLEKFGDDCNIIIMSDHGFDFDGTTHSFSPDGLLIANGPYIKEGIRYDNKSISIYDILPTLLTLMGIPVGKDMHGRVIKEILKEEFLDKFAPQYIESHQYYQREDKEIYDKELDKKTLEGMKRRLKALGYID